MKKDIKSLIQSCCIQFRKPPFGLGRLTHPSVFAMLAVLGMVIVGRLVSRSAGRSTSFVKGKSKKIINGHDIW